MSEVPEPPNADETRVANDLDRVSALDPTATRVAADLGSPAPDFDPAATRIGARDLMPAPRPPGSDEGLERFKIGDRIGDRYEVLAIHRGAMGVVYGTFDHELRLPRALKGVQDRFAGNARLRNAFAAEAAVWVRLEKHPFIARAYGVQTFEGRRYVVAEYIRGGEGRGPDLRSWIGDASVGLQVSVEIALQIAQGMQHAVRRVPGLVHCDLKPANILVNDRAQAMVTDFGLAAGGGLEGGTPAYMAPEQWRGKPPDIRTDIYAYGCILYELFTLHRVFAARTEQEWRLSHLNEQPYSPRAHRAELPEELEDLVLRCLSKERANRPTSWDEVVVPCARWFHILTGQAAVLDFTAYALDAWELFDAAHSLWQLAGHSEEQLRLCERALAAGATTDTLSAALLAFKGASLDALGRSAEALAVFSEIGTRFADASEPSVRVWTMKAALGKGRILDALDRGEEAILAYDSVTHFADAAEACNLKEVAEALTRKAFILSRMGRAVEMERVCAKIISRFTDAVDVGIQIHVAKAYVSRGLALSQIGRGEDATQAYDEVVARFADSAKEDVREVVAIALNAKGTAYSRLGRGEEEIRAYDEVAARFQYAPECGVRMQVAQALCNKSVRLGQLGRGEEAIRVSDDVVARFDLAREAGFREQVAKALVNKGVRLGQLGRTEEAICVCADVVDRYGDDRDSGIRDQVALGLITKAVLLQQLGRGEEVVQAYNEVTVRFLDAQERSIQKWVAVALFSKGVTLEDLGRSEDAAHVYDQCVARFAAAQEPGVQEQVVNARRNREMLRSRFDRSTIPITTACSPPGLTETARQVRSSTDDHGFSRSRTATSRLRGNTTSVSFFWKKVSDFLKKR